MEEYLFNAPRYFSDAIKLQMIFPVEIWLQILSNISESDHYHSICAGSPYFYQLLLPRRTQILFLDVIKLCTKPMVLTIESCASLLLCRVVCKTWKKGLDASMQDILNETITESTEWNSFGSLSCIVNHNQHRIMCQPNFYNQSKLDMFLETFHNSHFLTGRNPFPSRSINIVFFSRIPSTIYNKLFAILETYGHHIWHCYVIWNRNRNPVETQQELLHFCKFLRLLPNLQTLRINNGKYWNENPEILEHVLTETENTLPEFKNLELLVVHHVARPIFSQLIQNNPHIKKLHISELAYSEYSALFTTPLPNLEELHILGFKSPGDFSRFISVPVQWPLKKLTLSCHYCVPHVNTVFSFLEERWADTLTELSIIIPASVSVSEIESSLKLPSLKTLRIQMERYACLDFILHLSKSLVSLSIHHSGTDEYNNRLEKNSKIEFFTHMENLGKSNIWKFFPRLWKINYADWSVRRLRGGSAYSRNHWKGYSFL